MADSQPSDTAILAVLAAVLVLLTLPPAAIASTEATARGASATDGTAPGDVAVPSGAVRGLRGPSFRELGIGPVRLEGVDPRARVTIPLPADRGPAATTVTLLVTHAPLSGATGSLTVEVEGQQLATAALDSSTADGAAVVVTVPAALVGDDGVTLELVARLPEAAGGACPSAPDPDAWLQVGADSRIDRGSTAPAPRLADLPRLLGAPGSGAGPTTTGIAVDPDDVDALRAAGALAWQVGRWHASTTSDPILLPAPEADRAVGVSTTRTTTLTVRTTPRTRLEVTVDPDELAALTAVLADEAALAALPGPTATLDGSATPPTRAVPLPWADGAATLAQLGRGPTTVVGTGTREIVVPVDRPAGWDPADDLVVELVVDATAIPGDDGSTVQLLVNGGAVGAEALRPGEDVSRHVFTIPAAVAGSTGAGAPVRTVDLTARFTHGLATAGCEEPGASSAGTTLLPSTSITVPHTVSDDRLLGRFPSPLGTASDVTVLLPSTPSADELLAGLQVAAALGRADVLPDAAPPLVVVADDQERPWLDGPADVVVVGDAAAELPGLPARSEAPTATTGVLTVGAWQDGRAGTVLTIAGDGQALVAAARALATRDLLGRLVGDTAVVDVTGEVVVGAVEPVPAPDIDTGTGATPGTTAGTTAVPPNERDGTTAVLTTVALGLLAIGAGRRWSTRSRRPDRDPGDVRVDRAAAGPARRRHVPTAVRRGLVVGSAVLGASYVAWRWTSSIPSAASWIGVPLAVAETVTLVGWWLHGAVVWRAGRRGRPLPPPEDTTVDVFVLAADEDLDVVAATLRGARAIEHPHDTWLVDASGRSDLQQLGDVEQVGRLTTAPATRGRSGSARADALDAALRHTSGDVVLVLEAGRVPRPELLDATLGWFRYPRVAVVQVPSTDADTEDLLGGRSPVFDQDLQRGLDGWGAAFSSEATTLLRREALGDLGIDAGPGAAPPPAGGRDLLVLDQALRAGDLMLLAAARAARSRGHDDDVDTLDEVRHAVTAARRSAAAGTATRALVDEVRAAARQAAGRSTIVDPAAVDRDHQAAVACAAAVDDGELDALVGRAWTPAGALEGLETLLDATEVPVAIVEPVATRRRGAPDVPLTEDLSAAVRLHARGWRSVHHDEVLTTDVPTALAELGRRRRPRAGGVVAALRRANPLVVHGLRPGQRVAHLASVWAVPSALVAPIYVVAPVVLLVAGVLPAATVGDDLLVRLLPYVAVTHLLATVGTRGHWSWRGQHYPLADVPLWFGALAASLRRRPGRNGGGGPSGDDTDGRLPWRLARPQLIAIGVLVAAIGVGLVRLVVGAGPGSGATVFGIAWAVYDLSILAAVVDAVVLPSQHGVATTGSTTGSTTGPAADTTISEDPSAAHRRA